MKRHSILQLLDHAANSTGISALNAQTVRRRPLRLASSSALLLAVSGFVWTLADRGQGWPGYALLMTGFAIGNFVPILGPLKPWGEHGTVDEYDRSLRARAHLVAFGVLAAVAVMGVWLLVGLSASQGWPVERLQRTMSHFAFLLATIYTAGPSCQASWSMQPLSDNE